jgi:hypothetical protein
LFGENKALKEENEILKARLGITDPPLPIPLRVPEKQLPLVLAPPVTPIISFQSDPAEKIRLFMSLFKGREDVYAKRWQNRQSRAGYAPVCRNEWKAGRCRKMAIKCLDCPHQSYDPFNEKVIEAHLRGNIIAGLYPLCRDETCHLLAIDFDDDGWQKDCAVLREVCGAFGVPLALERSRSGNDAHAWFFFAEPLPASLARRFGSALLTCAMHLQYVDPVC